MSFAGYSALCTALGHVTSEFAAKRERNARRASETEIALAGYNVALDGYTDEWDEKPTTLAECAEAAKMARIERDRKELEETGSPFLREARIGKERESVAEGWHESSALRKYLEENDHRIGERCEDVVKSWRRSDKLRQYRDYTDKRDRQRQRQSYLAMTRYLNKRKQ